jgi:carboxypeptidase C (cathepsin A)
LLSSFPLTIIGIFAHQDCLTMNFRFLLLFAALGLGACDGSDSSTKSTGTFDAGTAAVQEKEKVNSELGQKTAALKAAESRLSELVEVAGTKSVEIETASLKLKEQQAALEKLEGPGGAIESAKTVLDNLTREGSNPGEIAKAKADLSKLENLKNAAIKDVRAAKLEAAHIRSDDLIEKGSFTEAANIFAAAGLSPESQSLLAVEALVKAGKFKDAGTELTKVGPVKAVAALYTRGGRLLADKGVEDEAFDLLAPADFALKDPVEYKFGVRESIPAAAVDETASAKRHQMSINDKMVHFTARAGHLIAERKDKKKAAIFYTAYTRDGLPREKRPVTFFWNGGPGSASIWLHLGSFGPKRLNSDAPNIPAQFHNKQPREFPSENNSITLLDKTDLVFVDPPGTGLSSAIAPSNNKDFWGVDVDGEVVAAFITAYNNRYNRQSSPKYLYGESYGGIRTPIVANLLLEAGTASFTPDPSGKPAIVLSGMILNSPLLDYTHYCDMNDVRSVKSNYVSCAGFLPSYAMTANYFNLPKARNITDKEVYLRLIENFVRDVYQPTLANHPTKFDKGRTSPWSRYTDGNEGKAFLDDLFQKSGVGAGIWRGDRNMPPKVFRTKLKPGFILGRFDARMTLPSNSRYDPDSYIDIAFANEIATYLPDFVNYTNKTEYNALGDSPINNWNWPHRGSAGTFSPASTADLMEALAQEPRLKLLVLHGYQDIATPGYQTELDLSSLTFREATATAERLTMLDRMPVKWFEGGHMIYNTEESRAPLKALLDEYYDKADYSVPPPAPPAKTAIATLN